MFSEQEVWDIYTNYFGRLGLERRPYLDQCMPYITEMANEYARLRPSCTRGQLVEGICDGLLQLYDDPLDPERIRVEMAHEININTRNPRARPPADVPASVKALAAPSFIPPPPAAPMLPTVRPLGYVASPLAKAQLAAVAQLRSSVPFGNGKRVAEAATRRTGSFQWAASGPLNFADARQQDAPGRLMVGGYYESMRAEPSQGLPYSPDMRANDFTRWLTGRAMLTPASRMNCWEAVMLTCLDAGVVSRGALKHIHQQAQRAANRVLIRTRFSGERRATGSTQDWSPGRSTDMAAVRAYQAHLSRALGIGSAVPFETRSGSPLKPRPGDFVFFGGRNHVTIYLGRDWTHGGDHLVMSLHSSSVNGFTPTPVNTLRQLGPATFRPPSLNM